MQLFDYRHVLRHCIGKYGMIQQRTVFSIGSVPRMIRHTRGDHRCDPTRQSGFSPKLRDGGLGDDALGDDGEQPT